MHDCVHATCCAVCCVNVPRRSLKSCNCCAVVALQDRTVAELVVSQRRATYCVHYILINTDQWPAVYNWNSMQLYRPTLCQCSRIINQIYESYRIHCLLTLGLQFISYAVSDQSKKTVNWIKFKGTFCCWLWRYALWCEHQTRCEQVTMSYRLHLPTVRLSQTST